jgi:hypothetical protein
MKPMSIEDWYKARKSTEIELALLVEAMSPLDRISPEVEQRILQAGRKLAVFSKEIEKLLVAESN